MRLRQGGNQVRGGFVAILVARQGDVVRLLVLVSSTGSRSSSLEIGLEDVLNTGHQLSIGQGTVICGKRNVDAVQSLVGVLTREVSGGERVAGQQVRLSGGEGATRLTQGGQQQLSQEGVQGLGGVLDSLLQVLFRLRGGLGVEQGQESLIGARPAAGNQHKGCNEREKFTVVTRTVSAEGLSNNACEHAGSNVLEDKLVVGVIAGPVCGVGKVGFVQVPQHGFEGRGGIRRQVGAALLNPAVHGSLVSDAGSLSELGA